MHKPHIKTDFLCNVCITVRDNAALADVDPCDKPHYCTQPLGTVAHESGDCSLYYICDNGFWIELRCANGTLYNKNYNNCSLSDQAVCQDECPTKEPVTGTIPDFGGQYH